MAAIISTKWEELQENLKTADPRTKDRILLWTNPVYVWAITIVYLLVVFWGPKLMQNRKPYTLQTFMVVYNLGLVALSCYMFKEILIGVWEASYNFRCGVYNSDTWKDPREGRIADALWWYFFSKAIELMDTVLMVLRKKNNQITFLHWFHHASMLNIWWWVCTFVPGGHAWFGACLNCLVHVVMYSYYGLSVIPSLKGKLWWKRYITRFQLIQFVCTLSHTLTVYTVEDCDFPMWGVHLLAGYMLLMLTLFTNFYIRTYVMKKNKSVQINGYKKE